MVSYGRRLRFAFRTFFSILDHGRVPDDVATALAGPSAPLETPEPARPPALAPTDRATQILALLQRDGRLVDFLMEDLAGYPDAQVGAAVRDVHSGCRKALTRYFTLHAVIDDEEGRPVTVERDADPARIKVVGNVGGGAPLRGILRHRGWESIKVDLPPLPATGATIVAPAEVEVS
jgi:uncharacterized protein DUF2760